MEKPLEPGKRFYYGWVIALSCMLIMLVTNGVIFGGLTVYDQDLLAFLASIRTDEGLRGALKFRDAITLIGGGLLAPVVGAIGDRIGVRPLMVFGLLCLALGNFLYARIGSLQDIYLIHVLLAACIASCGLLVSVMIVSKWFVKHRGLAMGIAVAGTSLGNAAIPQLNAWLIAEFGWRTAFSYSAGIPLLLIPLVWLVMREQPADMGLVLPGEERRSATEPVALTGMSYGTALRSANFWLFAGIAMLTFYSILALLTHLFLHMTDQGFAPQVAAGGLTVLFILGLIGKLASGVLADRFGRKRVFVGTLAVMCIGSWMLISTTEWTFWPALVLVGGGWGGLYTLLQLLASDYFGVRDLGKILGTITVLDTLGGGMGPFLTGVMYDHYGSYAIPFTVIAALITLALVLATRVKLSASLA